MSEETAAQKITSLQRCISQARVALSTAGSEFKTDLLFRTRLFSTSFAPAGLCTAVQTAPAIVPLR